MISKKRQVNWAEICGERSSEFCESVRSTEYDETTKASFTISWNIARAKHLDYEFVKKV